jgi:hypothetical protein
MAEHYSISKLSVQDVIRITEGMYNRATERTIKKIDDSVERDAAFKHRDYLYSVLEYLKKAYGDL